MTTERPTEPGDESTELATGDVAALLAANAALAEENRRLTGLMQADPAFFKLYAAGLAEDHWASKLLTFGLTDEFARSGAANCFMVTLRRPGDLPPVAVTFQVVGGKTPHEIITELQAQVADLTGRLADAVGCRL